MMTNNEIVEILAKGKVVETMIHRITEGKAEDPSALDDLASDVYLSLLLDPKLPQIYEENHQNFYISRILMNNICSSSSPYYRNYILPLKRNVNIVEYINVENEGNGYRKNGGSHFSKREGNT